MAGATPPPGAERAPVGVTWAIRGLVGYLILAIATLAGFVILIPLYGLPSPSREQLIELQGALGLLSWSLLVLGIAAGLLFCTGLGTLWTTRRALGKVHATSVEQTLPWLAVTMVLLGAGIVVPSLTGPFLSFPGVGLPPPDWTPSLSVVLAGMRAIFAGLTLYYAVQALAPEDARTRLLIAMCLGVVGAVLWAGLASYAEGKGTLGMDSLLPFLTGMVAGLGTSAISLALFVLVYREIRTSLVASLRPGP